METLATHGSTRWLLPIARRPDAATLLFCLPYAGGSAGGFRDFAALAHRCDVEVQAVELPGHGRRVGEPPRFDTGAVAAGLAAAIDRPYVLFGHSLGARLAFEVARRLRDAGVGEPRRLLVSGTPGPRLHRVGRGDADLPDEAFLARVERMGGTPAAVLRDPELRRLFLPAIRADFAWGDAYRYRPGALLRCPITGFAGSHDPEAPADQMATWAAETTGEFRLDVVDGNHFFLHESFDQLADLLIRELTGPGPKADG